MCEPASRSLFVEPGPFFGPQKEARGSQVRVLVTLFLKFGHDAAYLQTS